jgi:hypothetical protein
LTLLVALTASACSPNLDPLAIAGKIAGKAIGTRIARSTPRATTVVVTPKGGSFCGVMTAYGWPPIITDDRLNRPLQDATTKALEHGEKYCNWKAPQP